MKSLKFQLQAEKDILPCRMWLPDGSPKAIILVAHGMTEHMGRYQQFGAALADQEIAVAGFDLRGHGESPGNPVCASFYRGPEDDHDYGWDAVLDDLWFFQQYLHDQFPGVPIILMGFSLGSYLVRTYLLVKPCRALTRGIILMGSGDQPALALRILEVVVKTQIRAAGLGGTTDLVRQLSLNSYNSKFPDAATRADWLTSDQVCLKAYLDDPLCRTEISADLFHALLHAMVQAESKRKIRQAQLNGLPMLILSGADDPVGNMGAGVQAMEKRLRSCGIKTACFIIPEARHDLLHQGDAVASLVNARILAWVSEITPQISKTYPTQ